MRSFAMAFLALSLSSGAAIADDNSGSTITYHVPGVTVIVQEHTQPIGLKKDPRITWIAKAFTYDCLAASCLVTSASREESTYGKDICAYADGKPMNPSCENMYGDNLQEQVVTQGEHSFQTGVRSYNHLKQTVCPCIVTYSIYDSAN